MAAAGRRRRPHTDAIVGIAGDLVDVAAEDREADDLTRGQVVRANLVGSDVCTRILRAGIRIDGDRAELIGVGALTVLFALFKFQKKVLKRSHSKVPYF